MKGATSVGGGGKDDSSAAVSTKSNKPKYSRFSQQELSAWKPILTPGWVISSFIVIGVVFIPIGLASLFASEHLVEIVERYDTDCIPLAYRNNSLHYIQTSETNKTCTRTFNVPKHMKSPVFIYYELDNYHQNHRRYVKSRSDAQLRGKASESATDTCKPEAVTSNGQPIVPCGLVAWSLFNDTYRFSVKNEVLDVSKKNIAWKSDQENKFGSDVYPKNFQSGSLIGGGKLNSSIPVSISLFFLLVYVLSYSLFIH
ncbi:ALA-interacting subunit 1-like isoform X2 [Populus alba x Populus x berolinensis]|uniref:ALA-interacting subunit n=1 Tax=Populus alba x Populus x berolinensis TaxID=444605 RepID=A0AAD6R0Z3_9ROSI|nr:ALA-interacting subunit 1-like isoform X2 [Populus alba x Populus x berolinensis]